MFNSLRTRLSFSFISLNVLASFVLSVVMYYISVNMFITDFKYHKLSIAKFISTYIDPEIHKKFNSNDIIKDITYNQYYRVIKKFYNQEINIRYIYTLNYDSKLNKLTYAIDSNSMDRDTIWIDSDFFSLNASIKDNIINIDYNSDIYKSNFLLPVIVSSGSEKMSFIFSDSKQKVSAYINSEIFFEINSINDSLDLITNQLKLDNKNRLVESKIFIRKKEIPVKFSYSSKVVKNSNPGMDYIESEENINKIIGILQSNEDYIDEEPTDSNYGSFLNAYSIIKDSLNLPVGVVIVAVDDKNISEFKKQFTIIGIIVFFITIIFSISVSLILANYFTKPLGLLINAVETLGSGNLEALVDISSDDEFGRLAKSFNLMVSNLKIASEVQYNLITEISQLNDSLEQKVINRTKTIHAQSLELEKQIQIAQKIQSSLLPEAIPYISNAKVSFKYQPMMGVGGDFIDFYYKNKDELILFICDVSGHGVPAAFLATMVKMTIQNCYERMLKPTEALKKIHSSLIGKMSGHFISAIYCSIDLITGVLRYSNAGHLPIIQITKDGSAKYISSKGRVISEILPVKVEEQVILLSEGDKIILYTDGITEARNSDNEMLGEDRLLAIVEENYTQTTNELCNIIYNSVLTFTGDNTGQFTDDITILAAEYLG
jgi:serine phosphatase RsbU (regulator of sigma subunit)